MVLSQVRGLRDALRALRCQVHGAQGAQRRGQGLQVGIGPGKAAENAGKTRQNRGKMEKTHGNPGKNGEDLENMGEYEGTLKKMGENVGKTRGSHVIQDGEC